jgi:hypothetical protein
MDAPNDIDDVNLLKYLLQSFSIGTSTAENDPLLETAKIETQEYNDLFNQDRIDLVRGAKGSGKTALYRVLYLLREYALKNMNMLMAFGVETEGDPLFKAHAKTFEKFTEQEFESFWYSYFVYLAVQVLSERKENLSQESIALLETVIEMYGPEGKAIFNRRLTIRERVAGWLEFFERNRIKSLETGMRAEASQPGVYSVAPTIKVELAPEEKGVGRIFSEGMAAKDLLIRIADDAKLRVWILLDRLDEVFLRRSEAEARGLRALLRAAYKFSQPSLRIKLFVREDIFETLAAQGFTALTHAADRASGVMAWSERDLLRLVAKRLASMPVIAPYYGFDAAKIDLDEDYRHEVFSQVFPKKIGKQHAWDWLMSSLADGKNTVTPRDVIDTLNHARNRQLRILDVSRKSQHTLIEEEALKDALSDLSRDKRDKYLSAEFPHLREHI